MILKCWFFDVKLGLKVWCNSILNSCWLVSVSLDVFFILISLVGFIILFMFGVILSVCVLLVLGWFDFDNGFLLVSDLFKVKSKVVLEVRFCVLI